MAIGRGRERERELVHHQKGLAKKEKERGRPGSSAIRHPSKGAIHQWGSKLKEKRGREGEDGIEREEGEERQGEGPSTN